MGGNVVSAAIVEGNLIIGLSDGSIINCGRVQGPQGLQGPQGPIGATGDRGTDGNTILSAMGRPTGDLGKDGDFFINTRDWEIYGPKSGGAWGKPKSMLPGPENFEFGGTITNMGGGGGGGSLGRTDGRPPLYDGTDNPPTIYPGDGTPDNPDTGLQQGDMWIDSNGALYIYYNGLWNKVSVYSDQVLPATDAPFVITTPNGEIFINQKQYNEWLYTRTDRRPIVSAAAPSIHPDFPAYPLRVGDYWIDSNNHLYYWNGSGWTPIDAGSGRAPIFDANEPTEHPDYSAPDNILQVGDVWYDTDNGFKQYIWDGAQWVAITAERVEAFTRFYEAVDPASYNSGNDGTCALTATGGTIETITNVKVSGTDSKNKVRYLYQVNEDIVIEDERNGAYAVLRVVTVNGAGDYDVELEHYNGVGNIDLGAEYAFGSATDRGVIPDIGDNSQQPGTLDDRYVNKAGDEMTGPVEVLDPTVITDDNHLVNKGYVDEQIDELVGLLGGIGSSNKAGVFTWQASGAISPGGWQFEGRTNPDYQYSGLNQINISKVDKAGNTWSVADFPVDEVLRIEDESDGHFLEGHVTAVVDGGPAGIQVTYTIDDANGTADGDQVISVGENLDHKYVERTGDSMTGDLVMDESDIKLEAGDFISQPIDDLANAGTDTPERWTNFISKRVRDDSGNVLGGSNDFGIRVDLTEGRTGYNKFQFFANIDGSTIGEKFADFGGGNNPTFRFHRGNFQMEGNRIQKLGNGTADNDAATVGQVKDAFDRIVDAASGAQYQLIDTPGVTAGQMFAYNSIGSFSPTPGLVDNILFRDYDQNGVQFDFSTLSGGERITLVNVDGGLITRFTVQSVTDNTDRWTVDVTAGEGDDLVDNAVYNVLFQSFSTDVDLDDYLKLDGSNGPMTGDLDFDRNSIQNVTNYGIRSNGLIKINETINAIKFYGGTSTTAGFGRVQIQRQNSARSLVVRGRSPGSTAEVDMLYAYHPDSDIGDVLIYLGRTDSDKSIQTRESVEDLISGGDGSGNGGFQRHGPWHITSNASVNIGQFNADATDLREIRQFTFHKKNISSEDQEWSDLQVGEVITISQYGDLKGDGDDHLAMISYEVTGFQEFTSAIVIDVSAHWSVLVYSDGSVIYAPPETLTFKPNIETYVLESQPATLNNVVQMAKKASVMPAAWSFKLATATTAGTPDPGMMRFVGGYDSVTEITVASEDMYGNGLRFGDNALAVPGSTLELYRKNFDGTVCLCRVYKFKTFQSYKDGKRVSFRELDLKYQAGAGTANIPSPGVMQAGAQYLLKYNLNFVGAEPTPYGNRTYRRSGDAMVSGALRNVVAGGSQPMNSLTVVQIHKNTFSGTADQLDDLNLGDIIYLGKNGMYAQYVVTELIAETASYHEVRLNNVGGSDIALYQSDVLDLSVAPFGSSSLISGEVDLPFTVDGEGDTHWANHRLEDVADPVVATDAATKGYIDTSISNHVHSQYHASENSTYLLLANHTKISQSTFASSSHSHSQYASSSHNHNTSYVKGNYTITKSNGNFYIS